jgi:hypothetical protein
VRVLSIELEVDDEREVLEWIEKRLRHDASVPA